MPPIATKIRTAASDGAAGARRQKPYDRQSGGQRNANKVCARKVLAVLSGGQPTELLKDLLQVGECFAGSGQSAFARQTRSLLKCLTHLFSKVPAAAKLESLSMLVSLFPRSQLRDFGLCFPTRHTQRREILCAPQQPIYLTLSVQVRVPQISKPHLSTTLQLIHMSHPATSQVARPMPHVSISGDVNPPAYHHHIPWPYLKNKKCTTSRLSRRKKKGRGWSVSRIVST